MLLTPAGRKYAWYTLIGVNIFRRIPWLGKFAIAGIQMYWFRRILKEGEAYYNERHTTNPTNPKVDLPGVRHGSSPSGREASGEVREVQFSDSGVQSIRAVNECVPESAGESKEIEPYSEQR